MLGTYTKISYLKKYDNVTSNKKRSPLTKYFVNS